MHVTNETQGSDHPVAVKRPQKAVKQPANIWHAHLQATQELLRIVFVEVKRIDRLRNVAFGIQTCCRHIVTPHHLIERPVAQCFVSGPTYSLILFTACAIATEWSPLWSLMTTSTSFCKSDRTYSIRFPAYDPSSH